MAISDKKQLDILADQNELVKDQLNLYKQINSLLGKNQKSASAFQQDLVKEITNLKNIKNLEDNINSNKSIHKRLSNEIKNLQAESVIADQNAKKAKLAGLNVLKDQFYLQKRSINAEIRRTVELQKHLKTVREITSKFKELEDVSEHLLRNADIANALGLSRYSSGITTFFNKASLLFGKNINGSIAVLNILKKWYMPIVLTYSFLSKIVELFKELDKAAFIARKEFGMMRDSHKILRIQAEELLKQYAHLGLTVESVYKSQKAVSSELGSSLSATKDIITQASLLNAQFGISEDTTVRMLKTLAQMKGTTAAAQIQMIGFAGALSNAAGVPLPQVMEDIAKSSETTRTMMSKLPLDIIKAAVEARRMGTTLDKMTSSSRKLLNFTESMEAEMEASVLLGNPINLQLARQLSYAGKIVDANKEILRISKQIQFDGLDPFQMESFARAAGKSVDELKSMLQSEREREKITNASRTDKRLSDQLVLLNKLKNANESVAKSMGENFQLQVKQQTNQERLTSISNSWKKVTVELGAAFLPIIDGVLKVIASIIPLIGYTFKIVAGVTAVSLLFGKVWGVITKINTISLPKWISGLTAALSGKSVAGAGIILKTITNISKAFQGVGSFLNPVLKGFGFLSKMVVPFLKWIPVIGIIITGVQFVYNLIKRLLQIDTSKGFWNSILEGIKAVGGAIYDTLVQPFVDAWNWIKGIFSGNSPSKLGLSIVNGLQSVGGLIVDSLTNPFKLILNITNGIFKTLGITIFESIVEPFKKAWDWIFNLVGKTSVQPSIEKPIVSSQLSKTSIPVDIQSDGEVKSYRELEKVTESKSKKHEDTEQTINRLETVLLTLIDEIKGLKNEYRQGVPVYLDGQLLTVGMNRGNQFRGNFGAIVG
jgi:hypothetical protein